MNLPKGWVGTTLGDIGKWGSGGTPKATESQFYGGTVPWLRSGDLKDGPINTHEMTISDQGLANSSAKWVRPGAVMIAMYGATIGRLGIATYPVTTNQAIAFVEPGEGVEARFLFENFRARRADLIGLGQGGAQPNISQEILKAQNIMLPPTAEQRRIVARLDALITRITRIRAELERMPVLATRYKKRLLAAAFSGALTADWRRRTNFTAPWRNILWKDAGETTNGRAYPSSEYSVAGIKLLRPGNLHASGKMRWTASNTRYLPPEWAELYPKHHITGAEIVINLTAQSLEDEFLARACLSSDDDDFLLNQRLAIFRPNCMSKEYCLYALKSPSFRSFVDNGLNSGSLIQHIHTKHLERFAFHVAPEQEQKEIVLRLKTAFARADRLKAEAARAQALLDRLESAILAKAFRGNLLPQDPNDEPASVILERIQAGRTTAPKAKRGKQGNPMRDPSKHRPNSDNFAK